MSKPVILLEVQNGFHEFLASNIDVSLWMVDYDVIKGALDPEKDDVANLARREVLRGSSYLLKRAFDRLEKLPWARYDDFIDVGLTEDMFMPVLTADPVETITVIEKGMAHAEVSRNDVQVILVDHDERTVSLAEVKALGPTGLAEARHAHLTAIRDAFEALAPAAALQP